jgi:glucose/arabinose dehydrogenase
VTISSTADLGEDDAGSGSRRATNDAALTPGLLKVVAAAVALLALVACSGGGSSSTPSPEPTASGQKLTAQVFATVTGDTFDAVVGTERIRYRVAGVQAPKDTECYAQQSLQASTQLLIGEVIQIEDAPGPEQSGAKPAYVTLNGQNIGEQLVSAGLARVSPSLPGGPPTDERLTTLEAQAKASGKGLWGSCLVPPFGFVAETFVSGIENPTVMAFAPDGRMFVAQKGGIVWIVSPDGVRSGQPFIDLSAEVNGQYDRGMLGLALDPDFSTNGYVYLLYTVNEDPNIPTFGRLTRYTELLGHANPASRVVLIGNSAADGFPLASITHTIADLVFGPNRELFVSAGDGAVDTGADVGHGTTASDIAFTQMFPASEDIGALRAQSLDSLDGKILRINPDTGGGLETNPFWTGDPFANRSRIFAYGMRNPFRIALRTTEAGAESLFVADVGNHKWEKISIATAGANLGWPCYEGPDLEPLFAATPEGAAVCGAVAPGQFTPPTFYYPNAAQGNLGTAGFSGIAIIGGTVYTGQSFPAVYDGEFFFTDLSGSFLKTLSVGPDGRLLAVSDFATGLQTPVQILMHPSTGDLYIAEIAANEIIRIRYVGPS